MNQAPLISLRGITHRYAGVLALANIDLDVATGRFLAVLGANGAGKSTLAQILAGALRPTSGRVQVGEADVTTRAGRTGLMREGIALIPEGRRLFGQLSIEDNLLLGAYAHSRGERHRRLERILALMPPALQNGRGRAAVTLSGGEAQMLAVGRALMAEPRAIIVDEPSLGLAPILIAKVYELLAALRAQGVTVVVFEQLAAQAVQHADEIAVIDQGQIIHRGGVDAAATTEALKLGYFGHA